MPKLYIIGELYNFYYIIIYINNRGIFPVMTAMNELTLLL